MKNKRKYTSAEVDLFNILLDLNYSEPHCTMMHLEYATGLPRRHLAPVLGDLISKGKVLSGNEEVLGGLVHTYTPIVGRGAGTAYGFPLDYFTYEVWSQFQLKPDHDTIGLSKVN
jgi:hypothetical protein